MTEEQKAEQAWRDNAKLQTTHIGEYMDGHRDTLSALKREIEKRIKEIESLPPSGEYYWVEKTFRAGQIQENERFLKLIGEVKP